MNTKLILIVLVVAGLSSCSTVYKIEQTPDDVYYSPAPPRNDYVQTTTEEDRNVYNSSAPEDRQIIRGINNRRWRRYHNYDYDYSYPYAYGYVYGYPYGGYPVYIDPKAGTPRSTYIAPRKYDLGTYTMPPVSAYTLDSKTGKIVNAPPRTSTTPVRTFTKPNSGTGVGNLIRKVISTPSSNINNNDNATQSRSFEPSRNNNNSSSSSSSSSRSSSSSSSSGSSAPVRTFNK